MAISDSRAGAAVVSATTPVRYVQWGAVFAGAIAAAALAFVLHTFAAAVGLAVSSTAPTWRDASFALWLLSGFYLVLVAFASYGLGGYIAGRMRTPITDALATEVEVRDGMHGLIVWGLATLAAAILIAMTASAVSKLAAPSAGAPGPSVSVAAENVIAYDLDRLFRGAERRPAGTDIEYSRAEAGRILMTTSGHKGMAPDDRGYLVRLVMQVTGAAQAEAERRVDTVVASAHENIVRARRSIVVLAFMAGAAAMIGAAAAWYAACIGGRHRDRREGFFLWPTADRPARP